MKKTITGTLLALAAALSLNSQATEVTDSWTISSGYELTNYEDYGNVKSRSYWGYSGHPEELIGSLLSSSNGSPAPKLIGNIHYTWALDPDFCAVQIFFPGATPENLDYLKSITKVTYGDYSFNISEGDGDKAYNYFEDMAGLIIQQKSCAFANAVESAYPEGSVVTVSVTREVTPPIEPVATLSAAFSLKSPTANTVAATGGTIRHTRTITNLTAADKTVLYWITTTLQDGSGYPLLTPRSMTLTAGSSLNELKSFSVPAWFPAGAYTARLAAVDTTTGERVTSELLFNKLAP